MGLVFFYINVRAVSFEDCTAYSLLLCNYLYMQLSLPSMARKLYDNHLHLLKCH